MTDTPYEIWCLVKGDTDPFLVPAPPATSIGFLKVLVHERLKYGLFRGVDAAHLTLAKVNVDLNTHEDEILSGKYKPITYDRIKEWSSVAEVWPDRPPNRCLHIFVIPPQVDEGSRSVSEGNYKPYITFHIVGGNFAKQDIESNNIKVFDNSDSLPKFFNDFLNGLVCKRRGHPLLTTEWILSQIDEEVVFERFNFEDEGDFASLTELGHYIYAVCSDDQRRRFYKESKEPYVHRLLVDLVDELALVSSNRGRCTFGTSWPFPLVVEHGKGSKRFSKYTPKSDFSMLIRGFPHCLFDVTSDPRIETDRWRMLLQASRLARLGNKQRKLGTNPPIIMAVYINEAMQAQEYLLFAEDMSDEVRCHTMTFYLVLPARAFEFIFRLHNFLSLMVDADSKLSDTIENQLKEAMAEVSANGYDPFTAVVAKRNYDGNDSNPRSNKQQVPPEGRQQERNAFEDPAIQTALENAGYVLSPVLSDDPIENPLGLKPVTPLKPTIRRATSSNDVSVVLKLLDDDTDELKFLRYFKENNPVANHVIDLIGVVDLSVGTVVSLPEGLRLDEYLGFEVFPNAVGSLQIQFLEGVAFLHEHKVAHLDLNPNNAIVSGILRSPSPRLSIIDFGLSIFVEDEDTLTRGYCGTRPWVAPEVGTLDGLAKTYSAMRADRWACGLMIRYFGQYIPNVDRRRDMGRWSALLMSGDPKMRPSLRKVLSGHRTAADDGPKRRAEVDGSDLAQKRAKVSSYV